MIPQITIEVDGTAINSENLECTVYRPLNAISRCHITTSNTKGLNYLTRINPFDSLTVDMGYSTDSSLTEVFGGTIEKLGPTQDTQTGQTILSVAYGKGRALRNTNCAEDYGKESINPTIYTPTSILDDIIDNRVNKNFSGGNTGYSLTKTYIADITAPTIYRLTGAYRPNNLLINEVCLLYQAYQDGSAGIHWFVDPSGNLYVDTIGAHTQKGWPTYYRSSQSAATFTQGQTLNYYNFTKSAQGYANKIILATDLRIPGYDWMCEYDAVSQGGSTLWAAYEATLTNDATCIVGDYSFKIAPTNPAASGYAWFKGTSLAADAAAAQKNVQVTNVAIFSVGDSVRLWDDTPDTENAVIASINTGTSTLTMVDNLTNAYTTAAEAQCAVNLGWNIEKAGSAISIPRLNFYSYKPAGLDESNTTVRLFTTNYNTDYFETTFSQISQNDDVWAYKSIPIGPYWESDDSTREFLWSSNGAPDWTEINGICFKVAALTYLLVDDLHIQGKIIREAYDSTEITSYNEHQKIIKMDTAVSDSLKQADDSGTAARLAYAELLRAKTVPTVGQIVVPLAPDILPGQLVHVQAEQYTSGSNYRIDSDFRVLEITHRFNSKPTTTLELTDDVINTFPKSSDYSPSNALSALAKAVFVDPEAKSLKSTGLDVLVARLSKDYA